MQPDEGTFGDLLRRFRLRSGLTQEELAARSGISVDAIGLLERGERRRPQQQTLAALADALQLAAADRDQLELTRRGQLAGRYLQPPDRRTPPIPPNTLVGRATEVAEAAALLADPELRLLTLVGPGGVGKTRLAVEIARTVVDGAVYVPLADLRQPSQVAPEIVRSLGIKERVGTTSVARAIEALGPADNLLLVDNFEHLLDAGPVLAELLAACAGLRVLTTSRTPLRLRGERVFPVPPLTDRPAVEIFARRAQYVVPGFALSEGNTETVAAICRRVDGLPLAIELAAPWVRLLSPEELLDQLDRLELLAEGARDLPERHQTLRNTLAWSKRLLTPGQQSLLAALSVFVGGFTTESAIAVTGASLADLAALVDSSLVTAEGGRFRLLEMVRQYAAEQLTPADRETALGRYEQYFLELAGRGHAEMVGPEENAWKQRLSADNANLRAAVTRVVSAGDRDRSIQFVRYLWRYWTWTGQLAEADHFLEAARGLMDTEVDPMTRVRVFLWSGTVARSQGRYERAKQFYRAGLDLEPEIGSDKLTALVHNFGIVYYELGEYDEALTYIRETVENARRAKSGYGVPFGLVSLGDVERRLGKASSARAAYVEALGLFRELRHDRGVAQALLGLAHLDADDGRLDEAGSQYQEAAQLTSGLRDPLAADCLDGLARYFAAIGHAASADDASAAAADLRNQIGVGISTTDQPGSPGLDQA